MMQQLFQEIDYRRLERLQAVKREQWKLEQQFTDDERRRELTAAALEALQAVRRETPADL
jgi:hypothetical protein